MILRAPEISDIDFIYAVENHPHRLEHGRVGLPYSRQSISAYVENYNETALSSGHIRFIICSGETTASIGIIDIYDIDLSSSKAFVSIFIKEEFRRKGIAHKALSQAISFARNELGLFQLVAVIASSNIASVKLFSSLQFKEIAVLPKWIRAMSGNFIDAFLFIRQLSPDNI